MKTSFLPIFLGLPMALSLSAWGQTNANHDVDFTIDEAAMIRLVDGSAGPATVMNFHVQAPAIPGQGFPSVASQNSYLQFTSVKGASPDNVRQVDVDLIGGALPSGIQLTISPNLNGTGVLGVAAPITLSATNGSGTLISGIQSAYTGDGAGEGVILNYALNFATQNLDAASSGLITLRYTISNS
jgi:hypothetical protein